MEDLSNKSLALLLFAVMIVSLFGTFMVLNKVGTNYGPTGMATSDTGVVNLTIEDFMSITTNESRSVDFGSCTLNESRAINLTSMGTEDTQTYCPDYAGTNISNISVRNNGNVLVDVSISSDECAPGGGNVSCTFLNNSALGYDVNGLFMFNVVNEGRLGYSGGCGTPTTWTVFNGSDNVYTACQNLNHAAPTNSFVADFLVRLPRGLSTGQKNATITFTAYH